MADEEIPPPIASNENIAVPPDTPVFFLTAEQIATGESTSGITYDDQRF